ncbi:MAG: transporter substrate-binding domain-containing protein, partial [Candidatus Poseidoniales archaeon]|nr:transporter substrate-binding domain-containing protein [Candidatus Poseidoniales archaeon]
MLDKKMTAMMMTLSMLAAAFAGCLGGEDEPEEVWELMAADDVSADIVTSAWDPIIPNLNAGEMCDAIISAMTKTDARALVVDFTRGYYTSSQGVIGAAGSAAISDVSDLNAAGTTIALQSGTTSDLYAAENLGAATIAAYDDFPSVIAAVNAGEADYAMGDSPVLALSGTLLTTFSDETFGLAVRQDSGELLDALNVAITAIVDSGEYDLIFGAWFEGTVVLTDDRDADTASAYPSPSEGSTLTSVLESGWLKICSDTAYPPFENIDETGNPVGFDIDVANALVDEIAAHYMGNANPMFVPPVVPVESMKIGLLNPSTGPIAVYAPPFTWAAQAAIDDL